MPGTSRFLQSFGFLGSLIAAACCLGISFVVAGVTAIGAGVLIRDRYLLPILAVFLLLSVVGTAMSRRKHGRKAPLVISVSGAIVTLGGVLLRPAIAYLGIALLLLASILDLLAVRPAQRQAGR